MHMEKPERVCVFCASSPGIDPVYFEATEALAGLLADSRISVNYGGGGIGLMGKLADVILEKGGDITGYIPVFMKAMEWAHPRLKHMIVVRDMHERKYRMRKNADAIIALPGGVGTLEELLEVITLKQLGQYVKPIIIINTDNFYGPLLDMLKRMIELKFMRDIHENIWQVIEDPEDAIQAINYSPEWNADALKFAAVAKH